MDGKTQTLESPERSPSLDDDTMEGEGSSFEAPEGSQSPSAESCKDEAMDGESSTLAAPETFPSPGRDGCCDGEEEETLDVSQNDWELSLFDGSRGSNVRAVRSVFLYRNTFNLIPKAIGKFEKLKALNFFMNEVQAIPKEVGDLVELERLQVKVSIPDFSGVSLSKLGALKELELSYVPPSTSSLLIFTEFSRLKCLKRLSICHFSIRFLPPEIGCFKKLEELDISFNKLRNLPEEVSELSTLKLLKVAHNKIVDVPRGLYLLQQLENLDLSNNRLTSLTSLKLSSMPNLQFLSIQYNRFFSSCEIPSWICCNFDGNNEIMNVNETQRYASIESLDDVDCDVAEGQSCVRSPTFAKNTSICLNDGRDAEESCITTNYVHIEDEYNVEYDSLHCESTFSLSKRQNVHLDECSLEVCAFPSKTKRVLENSVHPENSESKYESLEIKRRKFDRPVDDYSDLSYKYSVVSFCGFDDHLPDGFYDAGRDRPFMPLQDYESSLCMDSREVILLDREKDAELDAIAFSAHMHMSRVTGFPCRSFGCDSDADDTLRRASILAVFVSDCFGGSDRNSLCSRMQRPVRGSDMLETYCCTCSTGFKHDDLQLSHRSRVIGNSTFMELCENSLRSIKQSQRSNIVPIGTLRFGICRHRAVLMKYLCDRAEPPIPCELVRGYFDSMPHAWNVILVRKGNLWVRMIVDTCCPTDIREETDPEYFYRYMPFGRVNISLTSGNSSILGCTFPSSVYSTCDEVSSPSIIHCKIGEVDSALKVRELEVSESSYEEMRNFENAFFGEVRMLGAFRKNKCIVEIYGHHLSSKWVCSVGDNKTRILKSIIAMEYVKGGCLKGYLEKLAKEGKRHAPLSIALSIARDVAFALVEVHSSHIIHRDVKSENILIDLECEGNDGPVVVKLADFNRSVPLNSFLHTCSIAHIGFRPSNVCVGTPRWMAPEVVQAMNEMNPYGLEVDIWSYGCLLLELLTLDVPYSGMCDAEFYDLLKMKHRPPLTPEVEALASAVACGELDQTADKAASSRHRDSQILRLLVDLFYQCTAESAVDRPTAKRIYEQLNRIH